MRKVFLSFLGTNDYLACNYNFKEGEIIPDVRFVQEACIRHFCKDWTEKDRIFIFMTEEALKMNWKDNGHEKNPSKGLKSRLEQVESLLPVINEVSIPGGKSEEEIWEIFDVVFKSFEEKDELFLDITHAFRFIPMLAMVILGYAKVMRKINVASVSYGAMEVLGSIPEVKKMPVTDRNVPVFDLLPFADLQDWTSAVDHFTATGDGKKIHDLSEQKVRAIKKAIPVAEQNPGVDSLKRLGKQLVNFSSSIQTCRGRDISQSAKGLKEILNSVREQDFIKPLKPLLQEQLDPILSPFTGNEIKDGLAAARWCLNHELYQQGFTILQETLITHIIRESTDLEGRERNVREIVGSIVASVNNPNWTPGRAHNNSMTDLKMYLWLKKQDDLCKCMRNITNQRNDLNHAGYNKTPNPPETFQKTLKDCICAAERIIAEHIKT